MAEWWKAPAIIHEYAPGQLVVREDLVDGGSKIRFLPYLVGPDSKRELVYGTPFCGGAQLALSVWGKRMGVPITLFVAKRKDLHWRQRAAFQNGAAIFQVPAGRMSVVQHRARKYAADRGGLFLPLGFDVKPATEPFVAFMRGVREQTGRVDRVWCATGSGMLARCLGEAFPDAEVHGVVVGLHSRNKAQAFPPNVILHECRYDFAEPCDIATPFPACRNYERKAFEIMAKEGRGRTLFWNVVGDAPLAEATSAAL